MVTDVLAMQGAKASATMVLTMEDKCVLVFHQEGFHLPVLFQCYEMIRNILMFPKIFSVPSFEYDLGYECLLLCWINFLFGSIVNLCDQGILTNCDLWNDQV